MWSVSVQLSEVVGGGVGPKSVIVEAPHGRLMVGPPLMLILGPEVIFTETVTQPLGFATAVVLPGPALITTVAPGL